MENKISLSQINDSIEIADLEYDVAGAGSRDATDTDQNEAAAYLFTFRAPASN